MTPPPCVRSAEHTPTRLGQGLQRQGWVRGTQGQQRQGWVRSYGKRDDSRATERDGSGAKEIEMGKGLQRKGWVRGLQREGWVRGYRERDGSGG